MADADPLAPELKERLAALGDIQVLLVMPGLATADALRDAAKMVGRAMEPLAPGGRTVLVHPDGIVADRLEVGAEAGPALLPLAFPLVDHLPPAGQSLAEAYRTVFHLSSRAGARGSAMVGSDPATISAEALRRLVEPVLDGVDLVTPLYLRRRYEGLLLSAVVAPLLRALYGYRILYPIGADFGFSARMIEQQIQLPSAGREGIPVWLTSDAATAGFRLAQAHLGIALPAQRDPPEVSAAVAQVLGPLFLDLERKAPSWQKVRGSQAVPTLGTARVMVDEPPPVDLSRMIETFGLGFRNLQGVWGAVLPPAALLELKRLSGMAPAEFRLPDELWARIVYDFALAHRLRLMSRDHLLKAMTPIYLAWVASYANEVGTAPAVAVEYRLERLGATFEAQKPYLMSRWRWPDRFQP